MKWHAVTDKPGAYEIRPTSGEIFGGIVIDAKNHGVGFVGSLEGSHYIFDFEDGVFSKSVKVYSGDRENQIGTVNLGFIDNGTLETATGNYGWSAVGSSKTWTDIEKNSVMFLDLENDVEKPITVLISEDLDDKRRDLLLLCGWYLLVVEYRTGFTNSKLAGMPVKTEEFQKAATQSSDHGDWWDVIVAISIDS